MIFADGFESGSLSAWTSSTIDLGDLPAACVGDEVTLLDSDPVSPVSVYELAKWADTIPYELFCRIGSRIPRIAVEPKQVQFSPAQAASGRGE